MRGGPRWSGQSFSPPYYLILLPLHPPPKVMGCSPIWPFLREFTFHLALFLSSLLPSRIPPGHSSLCPGSSAHQFLHFKRPSSALSSPQGDPGPNSGQSPHSPWTAPGFLQAQDGVGGLSPASSLHCGSSLLRCPGQPSPQISRALAIGPPRLLLVQQIFFFLGPLNPLTFRGLRLG